MAGSNTLLLLGGGAVVLYLLSKSQTAQQQQLTAQQQMQQQQLQQQGTQSYIRQGTSLLQSLFGSGTRGGSNWGYGNSQAGNPSAGGFAYDPSNTYVNGVEQSAYTPGYQPPNIGY